MRRRFTGQESPIVNDPYAIVLAHFNGDYINEANRQQLTNNNTSFNTGKFGQGLQFNSSGHISENRFIPEYNSITTSFWIYADGENTSNEFQINYNGANAFIIGRTEGYQYIIGTGIYNSIITLNAGWNYIVYTLERSGTLTGLANYYVNGNKILTDPVTVNFSSNGISSIGASVIRNGTLIDELAINRGYRSPLIIPSREYSSLEDIYPIADPEPDKSLLLCHFNNNLIDSVNNITPTLSTLPAPVYSFTDGMFSTQCLRKISGSFTYSLPSVQSFNQLVFDFWTYSDGTSKSQAFTIYGLNITFNITMSISTSGISFSTNDNVIIGKTIPIGIGWHHCLLTIGNVASVWVDGELVNLANGSNRLSTMLQLALAYNGNIWIDELYITSGFNRVPQSNFTPPDNEYIYVG